MSIKINYKINIIKTCAVMVMAVFALGAAMMYEPVFIKPNDVSERLSQISLDDSNNAYANIPNDEIQFSEVDGDFAWNTTDPYYGYDNSPVVALVHVDSIDGGRTYSPISEQYVFSQTIGKLTVKEVYKGDVKEGQQLNYARLGGVVGYDDYWNSLNKQQQDKILYLNNGKKPTEKKYVKDKFKDDIDVEANKNYIVFLVPQSSKDGKVKEYFMNGMQYGLREVSGYTEGSNTDIMVKNNETGQWEKPGSLLKSYK